jgi:two-component system chemotaxis response regulator CheB
MNLVVIAASQGGVQAVGDLLSALPSDFPAAVLVVQHRAAQFSPLADVLGNRTALPVKDTEDGEAIRTGMVYLAPPDHHLLLALDATLRLTQSPKVKHVRPAADVLFESVAANHAGRIAAVVLTGNDGDGTVGIAAIKAKGGTVIVQEPATADAPSMPLNALNTGGVDKTLPLWELGPALVKWSLNETE